MSIAGDISSDGKRCRAVARGTAGVPEEPSRPDIAVVGKRIAYYRRQRSWTQDNLAFAVGVSRPSIANLERGRYDAKLSIVLDIAEALDVDPSILFAENADPPDLKVQIAASTRDGSPSKQCKACSRPAEERGLCHVHYKQWRGGDDTYRPDDPLYRHLSVQDVHEVRQLYATGCHSYRDLARRWGVSHITIRATVLNQNDCASTDEG
jgi:DNA-binding XRE family transcriptional regulator